MLIIEPFNLESAFIKLISVSLSSSPMANTPK